MADQQSGSLSPEMGGLQAQSLKKILSNTISTMLNGAVSVTGTTPTINAMAGVRYVCGREGLHHLEIMLGG